MTARQIIFKRAWAMRAKSELTMSECMRHSWRLDSIYKAMDKGEVTIEYLTSSGEFLSRRGTLVKDYNGSGKTAFKVYSNPFLAMYFDVEKNGIRTFDIRWTRLVK